MLACELVVGRVGGDHCADCLFAACCLACWCDDGWRLTVWGETLEMKGVAADGKLTLRVKDYDTFGSDDDIGELVISMDDVKAQMSREGSKACWKKLSGVGAGDGELCVGFEVEGGGETKASSSSLGSSSDSLSSSAVMAKATEQSSHDDSDDDSADDKGNSDSYAHGGKVSDAGIYDNEDDNDDDDSADEAVGGVLAAARKDASTKKASSSRSGSATTGEGRDAAGVGKGKGDGAASDSNGAATVKVTVSQARKLTAADIDGASDPYVVVFLKTEDEAGARRTKTIDDTLEPGRACV